jgi:hypothetical protein
LLRWYVTNWTVQIWMVQSGTRNTVQNENNAGSEEQRREAFVDKLKTIIEDNCQPAADCRRIVKLCGQIAKSVWTVCGNLLETRGLRVHCLKLRKPCLNLKAACFSLGLISDSRRLLGRTFRPKLRKVLVRYRTWTNMARNLALSCYSLLRHKTLVYLAIDATVQCASNLYGYMYGMWMIWCSWMYYCHEWIRYMMLVNVLLSWMSSWMKL